MTVKFTNNASTTVGTGINASATSLTVASASSFPSLSGADDYCYLTLQGATSTAREVVKATALSGSTFTIVRAQDNTSAASWSAGDIVELRMTAALLTDVIDAATVEGVKTNFQYTPTAGQTVFSGADNASNTMIINQAALVSVYMNGVRLVQGTDYNVSSANNTVTLTAGATTADIIDIEVFGNFTGQSGAAVAITGGAISGASVAATTLSASSTATLNTFVSNNITVSGGSINNVNIGATTAGTGRFSTLTTTGKVGLGLSNPSSYYSKNLVVSADGDNTGGITIAAPATDDTTYLAFADGTSGAATYAGYVGYAHNGDDLFLGAGGATRVTIDSSGATFSGSVTAAGLTSSTSIETTGSASKFVSNSSSSGDYIRVYAGSGTGKWDIYGNGANLRISDNESAGAVHIDTSVGIGTAPATNFDVMAAGANQWYIRNSDGSAQNNAIVSLRTGGYSNIALDGATVDLKIAGSSKVHLDSSGNATFSGNVNAGAGLKLYTDGSNNAVLYALGQNKSMFFAGDDAGVGINALVLDMQNGGNATFSGSVTANAGRFDNQASTPVRLHINNSGTNDYASIYADTASAYKNLVINPNGGSVGIGEPNPDQNLVVKGSTDSQIKIVSGSSNDAYLTFYNGTSLKHYFKQDNTGLFELYYYDGSAANSRIAVNTSGSVGIGAAPDTTNYGGTFKYFGVNAGAGYGVIEGQTSSVTAGDGAASFFASTTGSSGLKLLGGMQVYNFASSASNAEGGLKFFTASGGSIPVRMTIKNTGYTVFGDGDLTTSVDTNGVISNKSNAWSFSVLQQHATAPHGVLIRYLNADPNSTASPYLLCMGQNNLRAEIRSNGGLVNFQSNNVNLSDEREKKNIEATASQWALVQGFDIKQFHYNDESDSDAKRLGVIAQEVEAYAPDLITDWQKQKARDEVLWEAGEDLPDGVSVGDVKEAAVEEIFRKGVKEQQMMWMAIKALQEAQERIESLTARVTELENN